MNRGVSSMMEWQRERERKLEERRHAKELAEQLSVRAAPVISKRSEALAEAARQKKKATSATTASSAASVSSGGDDATDDRDDDVGTRLFKAGQESAKKKEALVRPRVTRLCVCRCLWGRY